MNPITAAIVAAIKIAAKYAVKYAIDVAVAATAALALSAISRSIGGRRPRIGDVNALVSSSIGTRLCLYGTVGVGAEIVFAARDGDRKFAYMIFVIADGAQANGYALTRFWCAGTETQFAADGNATNFFRNALYANHRPTGDYSFTFESQGRLGAAHRGKGMFTGALSLRLSNQALFPVGVPELLWEVRGRRLYDPTRDSTRGGLGTQRAGDEATWAHSDNPVLVALDFWRGVRVGPSGVRVLGVGAGDSEIAWSVWRESAARAAAMGWRADAAIAADEDPATILEDLATACGGAVFVRGGRLVVIAGGTGRTPVLSIGPDDVRGTITTRAQEPWRNASNTVTARYRSRDHRWTEQEVTIRVSEWIAEDGGEISTTLELPYTSRHEDAGRVAKVWLWRQRVGGLVIDATFSLRCGAALEGDIVSVDLPEHGVSGLFEVERRAFEPIGRVLLTLRAYSEAGFAWAAGEGGAPPPLPALDFRPIIPAVPAGWAAAGVAIDSGGARLPAVRVTGPADAVRAEIGADAVEIAYRVGSTGGWSTFVEGAPLSLSAVDLTGLLPLTAYQISVRYRVASFYGERLLLSAETPEGLAATNVPWTGVGPGTTERPRPEDGATVGAPDGTPVGDRLAEDLTGQIDAVSTGLAGLLADLEAAFGGVGGLETTVDGLVQTYGDTASSAANALAAQQARDAAQAAQSASEGARTTTITARDITTAARDAAIAARNDAQNASSTATSERTLAETARGGAETARDGAVSARQTAEGHAATALTQANLSAGSAAAGAGSASAASGSASAALTSAGQASQSAAAALSSEQRATASAAATLPGDYQSGDLRFWQRLTTGGGAPTGSVVAGAHRPTPGSGAHSSRSLPTVAGRRWRQTTRVELISGATNSRPNNFFLGPVFTDDAGHILLAWGMFTDITAGSGVQTRVREAVAPAGATRVWIGYHPSFQSDGVHGNGVWAFGSHIIEDITETTAAASSATAANLSASNAQASATLAGQEASAANSQRTLAETARGGAETARNEAVSARDTAQGHASTASTQAGLSASSATTAGGHATAAQGHATTAQTQAGVATTQAGIATQARIDAQAANGLAQSASSNATTQAAAATTSAAAAQSAASLSAQVGGGSLNRDPTFAEWTNASTPARWSLWAGAVERVAGRFSPFAARQTSDGTNEQGLGAYWNSTGDVAQRGLNGAAPGWYVISADITHEFGANLLGAGVYLYSPTGSSATLRFAVDPDINGVVWGSTSPTNGRPLSFSRLVRLDTIPNGRLILHPMTDWSGFSGTRSIRQLTWHRVIVRPASDAEIQVGAALAGQSSLAAQLASLRSVDADLQANKASVSALTTLSTEVTSARGGQPSLSSRLAALDQARLDGDGALAARASALEVLANVSANLLANPLFAGGLVSGWTSSGWFHNPEDGGYAAVTGNGTRVLESSLTPPVGTSFAGKSYTFAADVLIIGISTGQFVLNIIFFNAANTEISRAIATRTTTLGWQRVHTTGIAPAETARILVRVFSENVTFSAGGFVAMRKPKLEQGSTPTLFSTEAQDLALSSRLTAEEAARLSGDATEANARLLLASEIADARSGQTTLGAYVRATQQTAAFADGRVRAISATEVEAAGRSAALIMDANGNLASIRATGDRYQLFLNGIPTPIFDTLPDGTVQLQSALIGAAVIRDLRIPPHPSSDLLLRPRLRGLRRSGSHGQALNFGGSFVDVPLVTPIISSPPALGANESYDIRAVNVSPTGFTVRAVKLTSSTTASYSIPGLNSGFDKAFNKPDTQNPADRKYVVNFAGLLYWRSQINSQQYTASAELQFLVGGVWKTQGIALFALNFPGGAPGSTTIRRTETVQHSYYTEDVPDGAGQTMRIIGSDGVAYGRGVDTATTVTMTYQVLASSGETPLTGAWDFIAEPND